jgi:hypothetical protein
VTLQEVGQPSLERLRRSPRLDHELLAAASDTPNTTTVGATRPIGDVEDEVHNWVNALLHRRA